MENRAGDSNFESAPQQSGADRDPDFRKVGGRTAPIAIPFLKQRLGGARGADRESVFKKLGGARGRPRMRFQKNRESPGGFPQRQGGGGSKEFWKIAPTAVPIPKKVGARGAGGLDEKIARHRSAMRKNSPETGEIKRFLRLWKALPGR